MSQRFHADFAAPLLQQLFGLLIRTPFCIKKLIVVVSVLFA